MNHVSRDRYAEELARAKEVVARHALPGFVTGFDVRFDVFDGDPMVRVVFKTDFRSDPANEASLRKNVAAMRSLVDGVQADLLDAFDDRFPYLAFEPDPAATGSPP